MEILRLPPREVLLVQVEVSWPDYQDTLLPHRENGVVQPRVVKVAYW